MAASFLVTRKVYDLDVQAQKTNILVGRYLSEEIKPNQFHVIRRHMDFPASSSSQS